MATVVPLNRPAAEPDRIAALETQVAALTARLAGLEARMPEPRFELPVGWPAPKHAAHALGVSKATLYRMCQDGRLTSADVGNGLRIDPASIEKMRQRQSHAARS